MMAAARRDRRVERTHRALRAALSTAILERGWENVSVREICRRARVARSTFYSHFADKEELLLSGLDELRRELEGIVESSPQRALSFVRPLLEHVRAHDRMRALVEKRSGRAVRRRLTEIVLALLEADMSPVAPANGRRQATLRFAAGALVELLMWWATTRSSLSVGELTELYRELARPALRALGRPA
jgi:AcrR family transcriptional regulator